MAPFEHEVAIEATSDEPTAALIRRSLAPEAIDLGDERAGTRVERDGSTVRVHVRSRDLVALRAGVNTWCGLLRVAEETAAIANRRV